jgi:hypothetical protein
MSEHEKFITPNLNRVRHGNGADALSSYNNPAEPFRIMGASPFTIVVDKPALHPTAQVQDSMALTAARGEPSIITKDLNPPAITDRQEKQTVQKLLTNDSRDSTALSAISIGLLALVTMLGVWLRRGLQPSTVRASSVGGDNVMEMNSPAGKMSSSTVGWGQLPSQNSRPLTLCYAGKQTEVQGLTPQQEMQKSQWVQQLHDFQVKQKSVLQEMQQQQQQQLQQLQQQQASANMPEPERQQQLQQLQQQHSSQLQELTKQQQEQSDSARNQLKEALEQLGIP